MQANELEELAQALASSLDSRNRGTGPLLELIAAEAGTSTMTHESGREGPGAKDAIERLAALAMPAVPATTAAPKGSSEPAESEGNSIATTVLKTMGMVAGVGPVITGLLKLFGGSDDTSAPPPLSYYSLPERVSVEAGLAADRSLVPITYSQEGLARTSERRAPESAAAPIQVNVQAMDSRSFLDHSDEIARAVRDAMLRSHSLNDVVAEM